MITTVPPLVEFLGVFVLSSSVLISVVAGVLHYLNIGLREPILKADSYK